MEPQQKVYGYLRISTDKQDINNNKAEILLKANELKLTPVVEWIEETISGSKDWKKRELGKLFETLKPNDVIITSELSRFARTINQIMEFMAKCSENKIQIYCTKTDFKIDSSIQSQMIIFSYGLAAQIERELISSRTKSALKQKKADGVILGRRKGNMILENDKNSKTDIKNLIDMGVKKKAICKKYNTTLPTLNKFIEKHFKL